MAMTVDAPTVAPTTAAESPTIPQQDVPESAQRPVDQELPARAAFGAPWIRSTGDLAWKLVGIGLAVALVFYVVSLVQLVFVALFLALVFTTVLLPLGDLYDRVMPRGLAMAASLLTAVLAVGGLVTYVVSSVVSRWEELATEFGTGLTDLAELLTGNPLLAGLGTPSEWLADGGAWLQANAGDYVGTAAESAGSIAEGATAVVLAIFCTVFFLTQGGRMWQWVLSLVPADRHDRWQTAASAGWTAFSGFTRGMFFVALADGALAGVFLTVVGVPLALPLSVVVFLGAFVPMIGPVAAIVVSVLVALAAKGPVLALVVLIGMVVVAQIDANVLQPLITGKQVSLHPVVMALVVAAGSVLGGLLGAVVAVPLTAVTWAVISTLRKRTQGATPAAAQGTEPAHEAD
ncbi:AI-2E family transporter [Promicromonospora iranensis]|uniref:PurR-regulated permease PerM n=1 Tax=Promicromonospora iranensis TaxID=1105144 RepID=A0ABU2CHC3_9MICO|nr:AI-2E family transporter [Promicromonospora iranensis]MDR7380721.1 putative PurR-regulated permease PerM [Promicromonospora iranensis]